MSRGRRAGALTLLAAICALAWPGAAAEAASTKPVRLHAFRSCTSLLSYLRSYGARTLGDESAIAPPGIALATPVAQGSPVPGARAPGAAEDTSGAFSQTNVQEQGIDEPDSVKTDGSTLFTVENQHLHAVSLASGAPRLAGSLALDGYGHQLLLRGRRLLVISAAPSGPIPIDGPVTAQSAVAARIAYYHPQTVLTEVDVSDPAALRIVRTLTVDGAYVDARQNGDTARVVIAARPRAFDFPQPQARESTRARSVRAAPLSKWLPYATLRVGRKGRATRKRLVRCNQVRRAASFSGLDTVTVLSIDLGRGLPATDADTLMSDAQTVYGSADSLYVTTQRWVDPDTSGPDRIPANVTTSIHRFDASRSGLTTYRSSGEVPGLIASSWSLSERSGHLRVASTEEPVWFDGRVQRDAESFMTVLREDDGRLVTEGRVGGLGKNQRIYGVRYAGDIAFVVTFRQIDPLYTLDLSRPSAPRVVGELELLGYSAYLHPIGDDMLLGVGQDADAAGRRAGTQLSLFDVRDPAHVRRIAHRVVSPSSSSSVEFDPHAFLYWPQTKLAVLPVSDYGGVDGTGPRFDGALGYHLGPERGVQPAGRVSHELAGSTYSIERSLVARGRLFTVSAGGVEASALDDLSELSFLPFPDATGGGGTVEGGPPTAAAPSGS